MQALTRPTLAAGWTALFAVCAGALLGASFAPIGLGPLALLGVALFTWLVAGQRARVAVGVGALTGLSWNALCLHWVGVLGIPVAIGLVGFMTLWVMVLAWCISHVTRLKAWPFLVPATWVGVEFLAGTVPFGGFPWLRLGYTVVDHPLAGWLWLVGATGATYLVALSATLILAAGLGKRLVPLLVSLALFLTGAALYLVPIQTPTDYLRLGMVQGNVNREEHGTATYATSVTNNHLSETVFLLADLRAHHKPDLDAIVWPENATDTDPTQDEPTRVSITHASALAGIPILVGAVMLGEPDTRQTSSLWWNPDNTIESRYDKRNLVPFGEWIPFREVLLPRFPILRQVGRQSVPGTVPGVMKAPTHRFPRLALGTIVCFELAWDSTSYDTIRHGGQVIVSQSNTNTYAGTFQPAQQMALNRVRALETRREILASTLNGWSGLVDAHGKLHGTTRELTSAHRVFEMPLRYRISPAVRLNPWLTYAIAAIGGLSVIAGRVRLATLRRSTPRVKRGRHV